MVPVNIGDPSREFIMIFEYSTASVAVERGYEYWHDVVCKHCLPAASKRLTETPFHGRLAMRSAGMVDVSTMTAPYHQWSREPQHIQMREEDDLWLGYMRSGVGWIEQSGRQVELQQGAMTLYDAARPYRCTIDARQVYMVRFPRRLLLQRCVVAESMTATILDQARPGVVPLRALLEQIGEVDFKELNPSVGAQLGSTLLDLLGVALNFHLDSQHRPSANDLYRRVMQRIERHFLDPEISLQALANEHDVSTRTITRAFAKHDHTVMGVIWRMRLEASRRSLMEGRSRNVTEAAFDHGFSDVSHFSAAFRKMFGCTPGSVLRKR